MTVSVAIPKSLGTENDANNQRAGEMVLQT